MPKRYVDLGKGDYHGISLNIFTHPNHRYGNNLRCGTVFTTSGTIQEYRANRYRRDFSHYPVVEACPVALAHNADTSTDS